MKKILLALVLVLAMCLSFISAMSSGAAAADSITVYVTANYEGGALTATGSGDKGSSGKYMIDTAVELSSSSATVGEALEQLANDYYASDGTGYSSYDLSGSTYLSDYWGHSSGNSHDLASAILLNGADTGWGDVSTKIIDGDHLMLTLYNYSGSACVASYITDSGGDYIGAADVKTGTVIDFSAYDIDHYDSSNKLVKSKEITSGYRYYVTADPSTLGTALESSSYTFGTAGTYYIVGQGTGYGIAAAMITVADTITNSRPVLRNGVSPTANASTYVGKSYTPALSKIFKDANGDNLTYKVSIDGTDAVTASASYSYTPSAVGTTTLAFSSNDGTADSADIYTVTLTATAAPASATALSALAAYFSTSANVLPFSSSDPNTQWAIADIMAYDPSLLSSDIKQAYVDYVVSAAPSSTSAADLARYIITLKAIGYDATKIDTTGNGTYFDAVAKMNNLIKSTDSVYTLPYMLVALQQYGVTYSTEISTLKANLLKAEISGGGWGYEKTVDADAVSPVLLALAPYYSTDTSVSTAIDRALLLVKGLQGAGGGISSWGSENGGSTGLMMAGLSALGQSPDSSSHLSKSLLNGIMLLYNTANRFGSGFYDEQGFRGLIAASKFSPSGYRIYNFSSNITRPAVASAYYTDCLVNISVIPTSATIVVTDRVNGGTKTALTATSYDLAAGDYSYTVSCSGYTSKTDNFTVTNTEAAHSRKTINVSLSAASGASTNTDISVTVDVKTPDASDTNNSYTYKYNASNYSDIVSQTVTLKSGSTVFDALDAVLTATGVSYTEELPGYISVIKGLREFDHGSRSGWLYMVNGTTMQISCRSYKLTANSTVIWFFTDDYTKEYGSDNLNSNSPTISTVVASTNVSAFVDPAAGDTVELGSEALVTIPAGALSGTDKVNVAVQKLSSPPPAPTGFRLLGSVFEFSVGNSTAYAFNQPVTLSFTFDPKDLPAGQTPSIYYYDETTMQWVDLGGTVSGNTISINVNHFTKYALFAKQITAVSVIEKTFMDVPADFWANDAIKDLYSRGCINGYADGSFKPEKSVTRAEFSTMLAKALGLNTSRTTDKFTDVTADAWYYGAVNAAAAKNLVSGTGNNLFAPNTLIMREQMAVMAAKALGDKAPVTDGNELNTFNDKSSVSSWAVSGMREAIKAGIVGGTTAATLAPQANATRAQAVEMIYKLLTVLGK